MPKGFSATVLAIIVTCVLSVSLVGWVIYSSTTPKVKGISSSVEVIRSGFSVSVASKGGTWDLYVLLCENKEQCVESLDSGVRWITKGGGETSNIEVFVEAKDSWKNYELIKVFLKPGWGSSDRAFSLTAQSVPIDIQIEKIQIWHCSSLP